MNTWNANTSQMLSFEMEGREIQKKKMNVCRVQIWKAPDMRCKTCRDQKTTTTRDFRDKTTTRNNHFHRKRRKNRIKINVQISRCSIRAVVSLVKRIHHNFFLVTIIRSLLSFFSPTDLRLNSLLLLLDLYILTVHYNSHKKEKKKRTENKKQQKLSDQRFDQTGFFFSFALKHQSHISYYLH